MGVVIGSVKQRIRTVLVRDDSKNPAHFFPPSKNVLSIAEGSHPVNPVEKYLEPNKELDHP
jgi:hypothetical protein